MVRNIVMCFDGTGYEFGPHNTNVVRLIQVLDRDPTAQRLYYDPGVGTLPEPYRLTRFGKAWSVWGGKTFGTGLLPKVGQAYGYLMNYWEPGDKVFLFGFSRGAYTARVLAGMLHALGLLPRGNQHLVPYALRLFEAIRGGNGRATNYWKLCDQFRWTFARRGAPDDDARRFPVHFMGLWDTVSSVGWVWDPVRFPYTARNPSVGIVRHAVSIDERRWFFRQNLFERDEGQDFQEQWFAGSHADVGGGYPERDGRLWRLAFQWVLAAACEAGMHFNEPRLRTLLEDTAGGPKPWLEPLHESLTGWWWLAEFFPKLQQMRKSSWRVPRIGLGRSRHIGPGAVMHWSTLLRLRDKPDYNPPNLSPAFVQAVRGLAEVPEALSYRGQRSRSPSSPVLQLHGEAASP